jgi:hypothetical protein
LFKTTGIFTKHIHARYPNDKPPPDGPGRGEGNPWVETVKYLESQPENDRKNGFGSKDARRRDEFTNTTRTEQYREMLRKEIAVMNKNRDTVEEAR